MFAVQSFVQILQSNYINNTVNCFGGVMNVEQSTIILCGNRFVGNHAGVGGAVIADDSKMNFSGQNNFVNNTA